MYINQSYSLEMKQKKIGLSLNVIRRHSTSFTFTLIGRVRLEGPHTQDVHRPITLAGADNPVLLLSSFFPHLSHGNLVNSHVPGKVNGNDSGCCVSLAFGYKCHLFTYVPSGADAVFMQLRAAS